MGRSIIRRSATASADCSCDSSSKKHDADDDEPAVTAADYDRDHACDGEQKAECDPERRVRLDRVHHSEREVGQHSLIVPASCRTAGAL